MTAAHTLTARLGAPALAATEWLLTNGLGGFAMGTAAGVPSRRYHAMLIAATTPPVGRLAVLNATVDRLLIDPGAPGEHAVELSGFRFAGATDRFHPDGPSRLDAFSRGADLTWRYTAPAARITRSLSLIRGVNAATIRWTVERTGEGRAGALRLTVRPLLSLRDFHALIRRARDDRFAVRDIRPDAVTVERDGRSARLRCEGGSFRADPQWWDNFFYSIDADRGQDCVEDLFSPGVFVLDLTPAGSSAILRLRVGLDDPGASIADEMAHDAAERGTRLRAIARAAGLTRLAAGGADALAQASDDFVVRRESRKGGVGGAGGVGVSIIAGYPWFGDWGRDTFVSLPGLLLATGRFDEARETLRVFSAHRRDGLIPNVFDERTGQPEYNTVDAPLWFIHAACAFAEQGGDPAFWSAELAPACLDIVAAFRRGIGGEANIAMDPFDKLITAGTAATQLTWMDARRDGVVFTPRHGKAVEINALWISGLKRTAALLASGDARQAANLNDLAEAAARSFRKSFWNDAHAGGCLYDVLTPPDSTAGPVAWTPDASIRPNQVFAVSLPHSPLTPEQQRAVVRVVRERLLTPRGLRTLDPADPRYRARYEGDLFHRDGAYHNGTAWPWLLGPMAEAVMRSEAFSAESRDMARRILRPIIDTLTALPPEPGACLRQIAEIYDGGEPQRPQGCPAQAWSVAEALRVWQLSERR
ncbi:MAG: amylo-alpha-1,6-glucosidase [Phycisphaerales bacterium]